MITPIKMPAADTEWVRATARQAAFVYVQRRCLLSFNCTVPYPILRSGFLSVFERSATPFFIIEKGKSSVKVTTLFLSPE
jgi:hypothetical protein